MRRSLPFTVIVFAIATLAACLGDARCAHAQREPVIVVPGRAGVPVMLWGQDVSGAVIEGEFGLDRPGGANGGVTVIQPLGPYYAGIPPQPPVDGYYPSTGVQPKVGRKEILPGPNRVLPQPAPSFNRSWTSESPHLPATIPPDNPPPVIVAPQIYQQPWSQQPQQPQQPGPGPAPRPRPMPGRP
jgi:hypothetical protein